MSAFLGPIHHWLFNKITLVEGREKDLATAFNEKFDNSADAPASAGREKYGDYFGDTPLEEMIGDTAIHQYLAGAIEKVETREAALLSALLASNGDEAREFALECARAHGAKVGSAEAAEVEAEGAEDIYRAVKNTFLDGMPCDHVVDVANTSQAELTEIHTDCLHRPFWNSAGADEKFMCEYLGAWIDGLVGGISSNASHERGKTIVTGSENCEDIYKLD